MLESRGLGDLSVQLDQLSGPPFVRMEKRLMNDRQLQGQQDAAAIGAQKTPQGFHIRHGVMSDQFRSF